ncbi:MAG TPA: GNAT family N-acetyltransferase [Rhizomicrobium sp.]|nr:GNAT family N-acetyltransferase [Rhizomicrobium sp.]
MTGETFETARMIVRPWRDEDLPALAVLNADPEVRRYYHPRVLTRAESDAMARSCLAHLDAHGFGFLALESRTDGALIGGAGLSWTEPVPDGPAVEIGWILAKRYWRQGFAREASLMWFERGWSRGLRRIVGYTSKINLPSRALMESLGMRRDPADDFMDPTVPPHSPLAPHVLYTISCPAPPVSRAGPRGA